MRPPIEVIKEMSSKKRFVLLCAILIIVIICIYPIFVLGYTLSHVSSSDLEGGRNGPLDAYRHTLASAVVAYTSHERLVTFVSFIMEWRGLDSNTMDIHNNAIGAEIGATVTSFSDIEPTVRSHILKGAINAEDPHQTTWLPREKWREGKAW